MWGEDVWKWPNDGSNYDYFFWVPWILPHVGALVGAASYLMFISIHHKREAPKQED